MTITFSPEGRVSTEQRIRNHAQTPQVHWLAMPDLLQHLGRHIPGRPTRGHQHVVLARQHFAQPKVRDHQPCVLGPVCKQQVLGLEVPVHNVQAVQVLDTQQDLVYKARSVCFGVVALLQELVKELAALSQVCDQVHGVLGLEHLEQGDTVLVADFGEDSNLGVQHASFA